MVVAMANDTLSYRSGEQLMRMKPAGFIIVLCVAWDSPPQVQAPPPEF